jgi:hypothetical protein
MQPAHSENRRGVSPGEDGRFSGRNVSVCRGPVDSGTGAGNHLWHSRECKKAHTVLEISYTGVIGVMVQLTDPSLTGGLSRCSTVPVPPPVPMGRFGQKTLSDDTGIT